MEKKGQAAFEFLITYGWAFLIILVMIGAFFYLSPNPSDQMPNTCTIDGMPCEDYAVRYLNDWAGGQIRVNLLIQNPINENIELKNITLKHNTEELQPYGNTLGLDNVSAGGLINITHYLEGGQITNIEGKRIKLEVELKYTIENEVFTKYLRGTIIDKMYCFNPTSNPILDCP